MNILEQIVSLFVHMDFATAILLIVGLVCIIGNIYQPDNVAVGIIGGICLFSGVLMRAINLHEGENVFCIIFILVACICIII